MPSSLLIGSPAAEDMFVDDADKIPSPLTNGTPVIPLKTKAIRKLRSKVPENEVVDEVECIDEDQPVEKKRTVRTSRSSRATGIKNAQSGKLLPNDETLPAQSRKSIDDFSPRSKDKMELVSTKADKARKGRGKSNKANNEEVKDVVEVEKDSSEGNITVGRRGGRTGKGKTNKSESRESTNVVEAPAVVTGRSNRRSVKPEVKAAEVAEPEPNIRSRGRRVKDSELPPPMPASKRRGRSSQPNSSDKGTCPDKENNGRRTRNTSGASSSAESSEPKNTETKKKGRSCKDNSQSSNELNLEQRRTSIESDKSGSNSSSSGSVGKKRKAQETPEGSSSKKRKERDSSTGSVRSRQNCSMDSNSSPSLRKAESLTKRHLVMFTGYNDHNDMKLVKELRGSTTDSLTSCTVLVTDQIRRTAKFLSMVARGIPIVAPQWLTESKRAGKFLDPWAFILKDPTNEKKWGFKLEDTLQKATRAPLLAGLSIHVTGNVKPSPEQCRDFIECGGGEFLETLPTQQMPGLTVVSCSDDKKLTTNLNKMGVPIMDKEWMLSGLLKYKLDKSLKLK